MAAPKSKSGVRSGAAGRVRMDGKSTLATTAFFVGSGQTLPKGAAGFKLKVPETAREALISSPKRMKALLQGYGDVIAKSRMAGRPVSFRVDVDPEGEMVVTPVEGAIAAREPVVEEAVAPDAELTAALAAARERGRLRAAEILSADDMLSAEDFAKMLAKGSRQTLARA